MQHCLAVVQICAGQLADLLETIGHGGAVDAELLCGRELVGSAGKIGPERWQVFGLALGVQGR